MSEKIVGILGGMGPDATVDLMARVIAATPASDDIDHIHMIVDNNPKVPSRIKALIDKTGPTPAPELACMAQRLVAAGADILAMPCNTAHYYYNDIIAAVDVPAINMIELVSTKVMSSIPTVNSVGLLATTAVQLTGLYHQVFDKNNVEVQFPSSSGQKVVMDLIKRVKRNDVSRENIDNLNAEVEKLEMQGMSCLIIACTELSVLASEIKSAVPMYDASQLLAEEIVEQVKGIVLATN